MRWGARSDGSILEPKKWKHMQFAKAMTYSCWQMYERQPTGLSPEYVEYANGDPVAGRRVRRLEVGRWGDSRPPIVMSAHSVAPELFVQFVLLVACFACVFCLFGLLLHNTR